MGPTLGRLSHFPKLFSSFVDISFCSQGAGGKDGARDWAGHRLSSSSHILCLSSASHIFFSALLLIYFALLLVKFQDKITKINAWPYPRDRIKICVCSSIVFACIQSIFKNLNILKITYWF